MGIVYRYKHRDHKLSDEDIKSMVKEARKCNRAKDLIPTNGRCNCFVCQVSRYYYEHLNKRNIR